MTHMAGPLRNVRHERFVQALFEGRERHRGLRHGRVRQGRWQRYKAAEQSEGRRAP